MSEGKRRLLVEALVAPGVRKVITSTPADSPADALRIATDYHGVVERPWIFDAESGEVLYRWAPPE